jgi:DNA primase
LQLLWKMVDEPILCFDGDRAGQKAAWRAAELALPHLKPGKSLRFAILPEGQDPDDLARSGGRGAIEDVIAAAGTLSDLIWAREIAAGDFPTPERRAALEARINEISTVIRDDVVKKYYRQDLADRLYRQFGGGAKGGGGYRSGGQQGQFQRAPQRQFQPRISGNNRGVSPTASQMLGRGPYQAISPQLATSSIMRGQRSAVSRREALILQSLINHPWLLHDRLEEVAALELAHPEMHRLRAGIIAAFAHEHHHGDEAEQSAEMREDLVKAGFTEQLQQVERANSVHAVWAAQPGAAQEDVLATWMQLVALHRQYHSLLRELKDAELALGAEASETNYGWLRDVKARLAEVDGTEALIEGFGELSGRFQRSQ